MTQDNGALLAADGLSPSVEPVPVSPPDGASIPSANDLISYLANRLGVSRRAMIVTLLKEGAKTLRKTNFAFAAAYASAMSARQGQDPAEGLGAKPASAVGESRDAPIPPAKV